MKFKATDRSERGEYELGSDSLIWWAERRKADTKVCTQEEVEASQVSQPFDLYIIKCTTDSQENPRLFLFASSIEGPDQNFGFETEAGFCQGTSVGKDFKEKGSRVLC